jgi:hypothetical protein
MLSPRHRSPDQFALAALLVATATVGCLAPNSSAAANCAPSLMGGQAVLTCSAPSSVTVTSNSGNLVHDGDQDWDPATSGVQTTPASTPLTIDDVTGVTLGAPDASASALGPVSITYTGSASLKVDDSADAVGRAASLTPNEIDGIGGPITFNGTQSTDHLAPFQPVVLLGPGDDKLDVKGSTPGMGPVPQTYMGDGNNTYRSDDGSRHIQFYGGAGTDTIDFSHDPGTVRVDVPGAQFADPPPLGNGPRDLPPPAWLRTGRVSKWMTTSGYCWQTTTGPVPRLCADSDFPTEPKVVIRPGRPVHFHLGFRPRRLFVSAGGRKWRLPARRVTSWHVPRAVHSGTAFLLANADHGQDVSYGFVAEVR